MARIGARSAGLRFMEIWHGRYVCVLGSAGTVWIFVFRFFWLVGWQGVRLQLEIFWVDSCGGSITRIVWGIHVFVGFLPVWDWIMDFCLAEAWLNFMYELRANGSVYLGHVRSRLHGQT